VLLAGALLAAAAGLTTSALRPESALDAAITFAVVATAGAVGALMVTGAVGLLTRGAVLTVMGAWALIAAAAARRGGHRTPSWPQLPTRDRMRRHPWTAAIAALAAVALAWQVVVALVLPPFAFDAISYHLTIVASWIDAESIDPSTLSLCCSHYPANSELLFTWPMLMVGGDAIVDLTQFGFVGLGALSVAGLARSIGLPTAGSIAAAGLFAVTPIVLVQAPTNYADIFVAACALAALHALVRFAVSGAWQHLVVAGLAAGLLFGTKGTGVVWAATLAVAAVAVGIGLVRAGRLNRRAALAGLAAFLCPLVALGAYWYARNWIETGNPAYPFEVKPAGVELFDGPRRVDEVLTQPDAGAGDPWPVAIVRSWATDVDFWNQGSYSYEQRSGGLGPVWPWLALPLLVPLTIALSRRRSPALIAVAVVALVFVVQPYGWWSRFTIPLMGIGALAIVAAVAWAPRRWMRGAIQACAVGLALAGVALSSHEVDPAARAEPLAATDLIDLIGTPSDERAVGRVFFPEYRFLDSVPDDATVVVDLEAEPVRFVYPLFGSGLTRTVIRAGSGAPPSDAWVVTAVGRSLDRELEKDDRFVLAASEYELRVWSPAEGGAIKRATANRRGAGGRR
jgi:hypothetical protein